MDLPTSGAWAARCAGDGEFQLAARFWSGGLILKFADGSLSLRVSENQVSGEQPTGDSVMEFSASNEVWEKLLRATPPRFYTDIFAALGRDRGLVRTGDPVVHAQYYGAAMRAIELLRETRPVVMPPPAASTRQYDSPVGRYVHLDLEGHDHRIYFEEAGLGIPVLMQHTAGCHGSQWRHLFEESGITDHFRLIAYDLPYHGKSLPPSTKAWWAEKYALKGNFLRAVPLGLAAALALDRPVFMGCSVGGLLALDLAHRHPDVFRAVISVEGALKIEGSLAGLKEFWHPQVTGEYKARTMEGLMSPSSPKPYVKETSFVYASGWPPVFLGDLHYYIEDFDLTNTAALIDTSVVGVHILSGEYDHSGTSERGRAAHEAIAGSTWAEMQGVGHFPMSENPAAFIRYLMPILDSIRQR